MSAPTTAVEAAQPAAVADSTPAAVTTQQETKPEEKPTKVEEEIKQEDSADAQVKQEDAAAKADEATDVKMEDAQAEGDSEVKEEESASKPGPLIKTKAPLKKDVSNKKYDPTALPITDDPQIIRTQVLCLYLPCS
jgi:lupus La protein